MEHFYLQFLIGAMGGNFGGALFRSLSLGLLGNTAAGILGGGLGGLAVRLLDSGASGSAVGALVGSGAGGVLMLLFFFLVRRALVGN